MIFFFRFPDDFVNISDRITIYSESAANSNNYYRFLSVPDNNKHATRFRRVQQLPFSNDPPYSLG